MLVLGLQGSPRKKGNTAFLLSAFMKAATELGAQTLTIDVAKKRVLPCEEYIVCEKKGFCPIDDDMKHEIYPLLRRADIIVPATPIFFYNATAQLKALIDRSQTLWARKYRLKLSDPNLKWRRGFFLSVAATAGKNLFDGLELTLRYFFDAVGASYEGNLTYRKIEGPRDMDRHPTVRDDVRKAAERLIAPFLGRKKILFACRENACRSQMAAAFTQHLAGDRIEVLSGGSDPAEKINPVMVDVMKEKGIDMGFRETTSLNLAISEVQPEMIVTMGCREACPFIPGAKLLDWDLPDPAGKPIKVMCEVRDEIETRVKNLIDRL